MADVITRFKLETTQFDSKLRDSAQSLSQLTRHLQLAGKDFDRFAQQHVEAARSFGQVASGATNLKDELKDLVGAYNKVANAYNALTQEQKQSDYGKAMAASLQQLQGRIKDVKSEMNSAPGMLDKLAEKFTVNIDAIKLFNIGLKAAEGVLNVAKDAFFASEANVDEWGRTMQAANSLYDGFLTSLNNSDFSGFLSRIDDIVKAARKAYDELDRLGTMKTIQGPAMSKQEAENQRIRTMLMTGCWISAADGRKSSLGLKDGDLLSPAQLKTLERQLQNGMKTIVGLTKNEVKQTGKAIDAYYNSLAKQNGMTMAEFRKGTSSMAEFDKMQEGYRNYLKWRQENTFNDMYGNRIVREGNPYQEFKKWGTFRVDKMGENSYNELVGLIRQQQQQQSQMYSTMGQAYCSINRAEGITVKGLMNGGTSGGGGGKGGTTKAEVEAVSGSIDEQTKKVQELQKAWRAAADDDSRQKIKAEIEEQQYLLDRMTGKEKFDPANMRELTDLRGTTAWAPSSLFTAGTAPVAPDTIKFSDSLTKRMEYEEKQRNKDSEKKEVNLTSEMSKIAGGVSGIFSGIESLGVELPQGLKDVMGGIQGMISILTSISTIVTAIQAISAADALIPFARGGVVRAAVGYEVPGNHFSGDMVPALLNSGETVLNRAQSGIIASALEGAGNGFKNGQIVGRIEGEKIVLVANHFLKRTGQGELVTWRS